MERKGLKQCKQGSRDCEMTVSGKTCIHCRYTKCLHIGMRPDLIKGKRKAEEEEEGRDDKEEEEEESDTNTVENDQEERTPETEEKTERTPESISVIRSRSLPTVGLSVSSIRQNETPTFPPDLRDLLQDNNYLHHCFTDPLEQFILRQSLEGMNLSKLREVLRGSPEKAQEEEEEIETPTHSQIPLNSGPEMCLTVEEKDNLSQFADRQVSACRGCMPTSLFYARVSSYLGTLQMRDMLALFSISRKAQNYWHYTTMCSMPGFNNLTTRTQALLMAKNMQMCYSLTMSYYFFGHNATTAVEQVGQELGYVKI